jgi:hypothetical protein
MSGDGGTGHRRSLILAICDAPSHGFVLGARLALVGVGLLYLVPLAALVWRTRAKPRAAAVAFVLGVPGGALIAMGLQQDVPRPALPWIALGFALGLGGVLVRMLREPRLRTWIPVVGAGVLGATTLPLAVVVFFLVIFAGGHCVD